MTPHDLLALFRRSPLVASVQGSPGSPVEDPQTLERLALASLGQGSAVLRLQAVENIRTIRTSTGAPCIGLIKIDWEGSEVYITPTLREVEDLLALGCEVIALDGTPRPRPGGESLGELIRAIHDGGALVMADCDCVESVQYALAAGADFVGTTMAGYTSAREATDGPDFELLRQAVKLAPGRVIAEGRYAEPWQARAAMAIGAVAVVVGGALNDPVKQTRSFATAIRPLDEPVGAVDIGGTWIRFGVFAPDGELALVEREVLLTDRSARLDWISKRIAQAGVKRVGISTGGTVDPATRSVIEAKTLIPDYVGTTFDWPGVEVQALNDGLATAWGHAFHAHFSGLRVATLALGTGVGCGVVDRGRILMGRHGEYPRLNDQPCSLGGTIEEHLGGAALSSTPTEAQMERGQRAAMDALRLVLDLYHPDVVVRCGGVGLSDWIDLPGTVASPYGSDAGLFGAGMLVMRPHGG